MPLIQTNPPQHGREIQFGTSEGSLKLKRNAPNTGSSSWKLNTKDRNQGDKEIKIINKMTLIQIGEKTVLTKTKFNDQQWNERLWIL